MQVEVSKHTEGKKEKALRPNGLPESLIRYDSGFLSLNLCASIFLCEHAQSFALHEKSELVVNLRSEVARQGNGSCGRPRGGVQEPRSKRSDIPPHSAPEEKERTLRCKRKTCWFSRE